VVEARRAAPERAAPPEPSRRALPRAFYARPVLTVARDLIGKVLVHRSGEGTVAGRVVEAEAYRGPLDRAAHSYGGRRTARTEAMFGPPGYAYIFLVYGLHYQFNVVVADVELPHAVLIRGIEPTYGLESMAARRRLGVHDRRLCNGPGKLCQAFGLGREHYGHDLCSRQLYLTDGPRGKVGRSQRIGVDYAGPWAARAWRYFELGNPHVSVVPRGAARPAW
jgi:DNA-3-methyladenine glycosylase